MSKVELCAVERDACRTALCKGGKERPRKIFRQLAEVRRGVSAGGKWAEPVPAWGPRGENRGAGSLRKVCSRPGSGRPSGQGQSRTREGKLGLHAALPPRLRGLGWPFRVTSTWARLRAFPPLWMGLGRGYPQRGRSSAGGGDCQLLGDDPSVLEVLLGESQIPAHLPHQQEVLTRLPSITPGALGGTWAGLTRSYVFVRLTL